MTISDLHALWTVMLFVAIVGLCIKVYVLKSAADYKDAAQLPFKDDSYAGLHDE